MTYGAPPRSGLRLAGRLRHRRGHERLRRLGVDRGRRGGRAAPAAPAGPPAWGPTGTAGRWGGGSSVARSSRPRAYPRGPGRPCSGGQRTGASHTCSGSATVESGRRSSSRASSRTSTSTASTGGPTRAAEPAGRVSASGDSAASRTRRCPLRETASATAVDRPRPQGVALAHRRGQGQRRHATGPPDHLRPLVGRAAVDHQGHVAGRERPADRAGGLQRAALDPLPRVRQRRHRLGHEQHAGGADAGDHEDGR